MNRTLKIISEAVFYVIMLILVVAMVKMIMSYIVWDARKIFTTGSFLLTFGYIPILLFSRWGKCKMSHRSLIIILISSITLSLLAFITGTTALFGSIFPNFWIGVLLQAFALGILTLITTERRTIMITWIAWLSFSTVLMTLHLVNGTL
jgi:hypothetical protein